MPNPNPRIDQLTPWTSDTAPKGRKNLGLSVNEWRNEMGNWPREQLIAIIEAPASKVVQVMAAQELLKAIDGHLDAIAQACSFTNGKPLATTKNETEIIHVRRTVVHMPPERN